LKGPAGGQPASAAYAQTIHDDGGAADTLAQCLSCLDLVTLVRKERVEHPELIKKLHLKPSDPGFTEAAAA
jgi:hypothetical protein